MTLAGESVPAFFAARAAHISSAATEQPPKSASIAPATTSPTMLQLARLLLCIASGAAAFSSSNAGSHRHLALRGAIADFCERTFEIDVDEASDIEARVVAASPRATRQTYQYAVKDP